MKTATKNRKKERGHLVMRAQEIWSREGYRREKSHRMSIKVVDVRVEVCYILIRKLWVNT